MFEVGSNYEFLGMVESINSGEDWANINIILKDKSSKYNIKLDKIAVDNFEVGKVYFFKTICKLIKDKISLYLDSFSTIFEYCKDHEKAEKELSSFYSYAPINMDEARKILENGIASLKNPVIKDLTNELYSNIKDIFFLYPAATKIHHAYIGGLAYHTTNMVKCAEALLTVYPFLSRDLVIAGIILHDFGKVRELQTPENPSYSVDGQLIGHITMAALEIEKAALKLNYVGREEVTLLEHIVLSSHGLPQFGSPKRPMIGEALLVWFIDTMDSKFTVLQEELEDLPKGFTEPLQVLDKVKFYNHKI